MSMLALEFRFIASDLRYLAKQSGLNRLFKNDGRKEREYLAKNHLNFCSEKSVYDQVRYLDQNGMEVVRTDFNDGDPYTVADEALQARD